MKLGYACINTEIGCTANSTFKLASYSKERLVETVQKNLDCLQKILLWNKQHNICFFRIGSQIVPFASHPICKYNWQKHFNKQFKQIGEYVKKNNMRITMHPDQFVILNSKNKSIVKKSIKEIKYHAEVLDLMGLDTNAKIVIHVGGVYGEKENAMRRFVNTYKKLPGKIKRRLVIENDHRSYSLKDCLEINKKTGVSVVFDEFHHQCLNNDESTRSAIVSAGKIWKRKDGKQIIHYSNQKKGAMKGSHSKTIDLNQFKKFLKCLRRLDLYIMLEVKDKEQSVLKIQKKLNVF